MDTQIDAKNSKSGLVEQFKELSLKGKVTTNFAYKVRKVVSGSHAYYKLDQIAKTNNKPSMESAPLARCSVVYRQVKTQYSTKKTFILQIHNVKTEFVEAIENVLKAVDEYNTENKKENKEEKLQYFSTLNDNTFNREGYLFIEYDDEYMPISYKELVKKENKTGLVEKTFKPDYFKTIKMCDVKIKPTRVIVDEDHETSRIMFGITSIIVDKTATIKEDTMIGLVENFENSEVGEESEVEEVEAEEKQEIEEEKPQPKKKVTKSTTQKRKPKTKLISSTPE